MYLKVFVGAIFRYFSYFGISVTFILGASDLHTSIKWGWVRHIVICIHPMGKASGFRDAIRQILLLEYSFWVD